MLRPIKKTNKRLLIRIALTLALVICVCAGGLFAIAKQTSLPILMYHHVADDDIGPWNSMTVTTSRLREDMIFLKSHQYTPLLPADLVRIRAGEAPMPKKPVMITFDDGYEDNYTLAYPILRETEMKAVIAVIAGNIRADGQESTHPLRPLSWGQCREMYESGIVDIGSHTYALHNGDNGGNPYDDGHDGVQRKAKESREAYIARVGGDLHDSVAAIERGVGNDCIYFSYPFGAGDGWFGSLLTREGIKVTTTTMQRRATLAFGTQELPRYRITMEAPLSEILKG